MNEEGVIHSSGTPSIPWNDHLKKTVGAEFISLRIANSAFAEGTSYLYLYLYAVSPFSTLPVHSSQEQCNPSRYCKLKNFLL